MTGGKYSYKQIEYNTMKRMNYSNDPKRRKSLPMLHCTECFVYLRVINPFNYFHQHVHIVQNFRRGTEKKQPSKKDRYVLRLSQFF